MCRGTKLLSLIFAAALSTACVHTGTNAETQTQPQSSLQTMELEVQLQGESWGVRGDVTLTDGSVTEDNLVLYDMYRLTVLPGAPNTGGSLEKLDFYGCHRTVEFSSQRAHFQILCRTIDIPPNYSLHAGDRVRIVVVTSN